MLAEVKWQLWQGRGRGLGTSANVSEDLTCRRVIGTIGDGGGGSCHGGPQISSRKDWGCPARGLCVFYGNATKNIGVTEPWKSNIGALWRIISQYVAIWCVLSTYITIIMYYKDVYKTAASLLFIVNVVKRSECWEVFITMVLHHYRCIKHIIVMFIMHFRHDKSVFLLRFPLFFCFISMWNMFLFENLCFF